MNLATTLFHWFLLFINLLCLRFQPSNSNLWIYHYIVLSKGFKLRSISDWEIGVWWQSTWKLQQQYLNKSCGTVLIDLNCSCQLGFTLKRSKTGYWITPCSCSWKPETYWGSLFSDLCLAICLYRWLALCPYSSTKCHV